MALRTQGSSLYVIDPDNSSVITVGLVTDVDGIDTSVGNIDVTDLSHTDALRYIAALAEPGAATFNINTDPSESSHIALHASKKAGDTLKWALGWSDGTAAPTFATGAWVLPSTRSWITFEGHITSFPFAFAVNDVVKSSVGIQISGDITLTPKT